MSEMPEDMARAYAEAYPDRVPEYVRTRVWEAGKNSAARITELEKQLQFYADEHTKAGKSEKAATNQRFADLCRFHAAEGEG